MHKLQVMKSVLIAFLVSVAFLLGIGLWTHDKTARARQIRASAILDLCARNVYVLRTFLRSYFLRNWRRKNAGFLASAVVKIAAIVPFEQATIWWIAVLGWFSDRTRNLAELKSYAEFGS